MKKNLLSLLCVALLVAVPACKKEGSKDGGMKKEKSGKVHHHKAKKAKKAKSGKKKMNKGSKKAKDGAEMVSQAAHQ
jgi:hypothetical protein